MFAHFLETKSSPKVYFLPSHHTATTRKRIEERKTAALNKYMEFRKQLDVLIADLETNSIEKLMPYKPSIQLARPNLENRAGEASFRSTDINKSTLVGQDGEPIPGRGSNFRREFPPRGDAAEVGPRGREGRLERSREEVEELALAREKENTKPSAEDSGQASHVEATEKMDLDDVTRVTYVGIETHNNDAMDQQNTANFELEEVQNEIADSPDTTGNNDMETHGLLEDHPDSVGSCGSTDKINKEATTDEEIQDDAIENDVKFQQDQSENGSNADDTSEQENAGNYEANSIDEQEPNINAPEEIIE